MNISGPWATYNRDTHILAITTVLRRKMLATKYRVTDLHPDPKVASPAYRLTKDDGTFYDVAVEETHASCTCGSFVFRNEPKQRLCKHLAALINVGLIPEGVYVGPEHEAKQNDRGLDGGRADGDQVAGRQESVDHG